MDKNTIIEHINEPVIAFSKLGRLIGYGISEDNEYAVVKEFGGRVTCYPSGSCMVFLDSLKGNNKTMSKDGSIWDDYVRLDSMLEAAACPKITDEPYFMPQDELDYEGHGG